MRFPQTDSNDIPLAKYGCFLLVCLLILVAIGGVLGMVGYVAGWFQEAGAVAQEQLGPRALLKKYAWFKDAHAQLDARLANIQVYAKRIAAMKADDGGKLDRTDKEQRNLWISEQAGMVASYNNLAAEYNAQMSKINYAFCNVGQLPAGATEPLPRSYAPYSESLP